jgi:hypothetical protein
MLSISVRMNQWSGTTAVRDTGKPPIWVRILADVGRPHEAARGRAAMTVRQESTACACGWLRRGSIRRFGTRPRAVRGSLWRRAAVPVQFDRRPGLPLPLWRRDAPIRTPCSRSSFDVQAVGAPTGVRLSTISDFRTDQSGNVRMLPDWSPWPRSTPTKCGFLRACEMQ